MAWEYSDKTKQMFMDAVQGKPGTHLGEIENPDGMGEHGSIACGDALKFTFKVDRHPTDSTKDIIVQAKYLTFGCTSAIAASEALCAIIEKGKYTPIQAIKITNKDIVDFLGGLPAQKIHCSVMGAEALEAAVFNWSQKRGVDLQKLGINLSHETEEEGRIVCKCFSLSEPYIRQKVKELNLKTIEDITNVIKAGGACMSCHHAPGGLQDILDDTWGQQEPNMTDEPKTEFQNTDTATGLSPYQLSKKVDHVIEQNIRPLLQADGGDIEVVDIKDNLVYCRLQGACAGCPGAQATLKMMVERTLKDQIDEKLKVIAV